MTETQIKRKNLNTFSFPLLFTSADFPELSTSTEISKFQTQKFTLSIDWHYVENAEQDTT